MFSYLYVWNLGMRLVDNLGGSPLLYINEEPWKLTRLKRHKYYQLRDILRQT